MKRTWIVFMLAACLVSPARAAVNEVRVVAVQPDVQFHREGAPEDEWKPVEKDTVLKQGDEVSCDPDGVCTLAFADNSTVVVRNTTQLKIASFFTEGGVVRTEILLKMGEVAAKVNKTEATKSDFRIKSPTGTASVRGTELKRVAYTPTQGMRVQLVEGFANLSGNQGTTSVAANQEGEINQSGETVSPTEVQSESLASDALAPGATAEEVDFFQANVGVSGTGTSSSSGGGTDEVSSSATENINEEVLIAQQRFDDFNDGQLPNIAFTSENAEVRAPGTFGTTPPPESKPISADGTPFLVIHTGGETGFQGTAKFGLTLPGNAVIDISFDSNFITTEEPGEFQTTPDFFEVTAATDGGTPVTILRQTVPVAGESTAGFRPIDPGTLPAFMNFPGGVPPESAFETGFTRTSASVQSPGGNFEVKFLVQDGLDGGIQDTIIESAAMIDNVRILAVQQNNGVTVVTPVTQGSAQQAAVAGGLVLP